MAGPTFKVEADGSVSMLEASGKVNRWFTPEQFDRHQRDATFKAAVPDQVRQDVAAAVALDAA